MTGLAFVVAAAFAAIVRQLARERLHGWPGTMAVNVAGSLLAGWVLGGGLAGEARTVVATGLAGALTTMSGLALDALELGGRRGGAYVAATVVLGVGAAALGATLA